MRQQSSSQLAQELGHRRLTRWRMLALIAAFTAAAACGGAGSTAPSAIASVSITAPLGASSFQTFGRTLQFSAEARRDDNSLVSGSSITWTSSNLSVATISGSGLLTVVGNGSTSVTASVDGVASTARVVTVAQVAAAVAGQPTSVQFGALGASRQLAIAASDSSGAAITPAPAVTWAHVGAGVASLSAGGLATALANGSGDTAVASLGALSARIPIAVAQVVASVLVTVTGSDSLRTTGRTRQYAAAARDSNLNVMPAAVAWSSLTASVATVDAAGLATAVSDGATNIRATSSGVFGQRLLVVDRYAETLLLTPAAANITADGGVQAFSVVAEDSVATTLPATWLSQNVNVLSLSGSSGSNVTATAVGNGSTFVRVSAGRRADSAAVTVSGQTTLASTASVTVGDFFFRSVRNLSQNEAVDTVAVGGTVTWTWTGSASHDVTSTGSPSFTSSPLRSAGEYSRVFNAAGDYRYQCSVHATMTGFVIVR